MNEERMSKGNEGMKEFNERGNGWLNVTNEGWMKEWRNEGNEG